MGRRTISLFEQVYDDLKVAVKRAKQVCRNQKTTSPQAAETLVIDSPMNQKKPQRGRPKGAKDTLPRKKTAPSKVPDNSTDDSVLKHTEFTKQGQNSGLHQPASAGGNMANSRLMVELAGPLCAEMESGGNDTMTYHYPQTLTSLGTGYKSSSPTEINEDPPCWDLPIPC
jgi:hypothetical protein